LELSTGCPSQIRAGLEILGEDPYRETWGSGEYCIQYDIFQYIPRVVGDTEHEFYERSDLKFSRSVIEFNYGQIIVLIIRTSIGVSSGIDSAHYQGRRGLRIHDSIIFDSVNSINTLYYSIILQLFN
jgi:hypothetical protein